MTIPIGSHRDLAVWRKGVDLSVKVYELTQNFPSNELYGLTSQLRRAAVSVPANIAEGNARSSTKEYLHFLSIAVASIAELDTHLEIAKRLDYTAAWDLDELRSELESLGKMLQSLRRSLKTKLNE